MVKSVNNIKTAVLLAALFGLLVWVGSFWGTSGMIVAGIFALCTNFFAWFYSDRIAIAAMRGREVDESTDLHQMVAQLAVSSTPSGIITQVSMGRRFSGSPNSSSPRSVSPAFKRSPHF